MILFDTDVAVDILRKHPPAIAWLQGLGTTPIGLPGLVAMELVQGCRNKSEQQAVERFYGLYSLYWPTESDCVRAIADFSAYRLSHSLGLLDSLIANTAVGMDEELATFNIKHYGVIKALKTLQPD
jgi:predicted nucleic acid-binding protein